ncbi:MAG: hypothetical protein A2Z18_02405 [Armatimonadetes bacterium RBG_16_58_9]|nr:MAG: hypothetical protein A2Z18_02405 [Armatimonadetes bacterium RBG_16_58_9]
MNESTEQAAARFDDWAATYDEDRISPWFHFYQTMALARLNLEKAPGFLEVGCGTGWAVREAARRVKNGPCSGIDISPKMIARAKLLSSDNPRIEYRVANAESIPYPDEAINSILCTNSFHHYAKPLQALCEIRRVMRKGGTFVLLDSARDVFFPMWLQDRWRRYFERSHVRYYTTREIRSLLMAAELNILGEILTIRKFMDHGKVFTGLMLVVCGR